MRRIVLAPLMALAAAAAHDAHAADQARTLPAFDAVANSGPINVTIAAGAPQSVVASGSTTFIRELDTRVVDGELRIELKDKSVSSELGDPTVVITVPALKRYRMTGVGRSTLTHLRGDHLEIRFSGAGHLQAEGDVGTFDLAADGVGAVDARALHADTVVATVRGIGAVRVWAGTRLRGSVDGIGSLTYDGDPRDVETSGGGIGRITRGR